MLRSVVLSVLASLSVAHGPSTSLDVAARLQPRLDAGRNLVFSPLSLQQSVAMADAGARGRTRRELEAALGLRPGAEQFPPTVDVADAVWAQAGYPLRRAYTARLRTSFRATVAKADFARHPDAAVARINGWASQRTHGRIPALLGTGDVDALTRLMLVNAVYMKAPWELAFDPSQTRDESFRPLRGPPVQVPMMHRTASYPIAHEPSYTAIELPYTGRRLAMLVIVPDAGRFAAVARSLGARALVKTVRDLRPADVALGFPRFELRSDLGLIPALERLGVHAAFDPRIADFGAMSPRARADGLHISLIKQKAFIHVDETGTEAAAVTGTGVGAVVALPATNVDRPFLFIIRDRATGAALFAGRVLNPGQ